MKSNNWVLGCVFACALSGQAAVSAKPAAGLVRAEASGIKWRVVKAETYTFWDEWNDRMMRGVRIWIDSPGYLPTISEVIPDDDDTSGKWQLTDEQGKSYVKNYYGLTMLDYEKRKARKVHGLEFTGVYIPIPKAKVGQIRLRFPLELSKITNAEDGEDVMVQVDTLVTHHK